MTNSPIGFEPLFRTSPYLELIGPIYSKTVESNIVIGFTAQAKHCNAKGTVHGGIIAGIADITLGYNAAFSKNPPISMVTTSLTIDYVGGIKAGNWVEVRADVQKVGRRVAFANCYFWVDDKRVIRASGVFAISAS